MYFYRLHWLTILIAFDNFFNIWGNSSKVHILANIWRFFVWIQNQRIIDTRIPRILRSGINNESDNKNIFCAMALLSLVHKSLTTTNKKHTCNQINALEFPENLESLFYTTHFSNFQRISGKTIRTPTTKTWHHFPVSSYLFQRM